MNEPEIKEYLAPCLDALQEACEALEDVKEEDHELNSWHTQIDNLYGKILHRYER